jgi:Tol biopolymer transport system component
VSSSRRALIVAIDSYVDGDLASLASAAADAVALEEVLASPDIGGFDVEISQNQPHYVIQETIEDFFAAAAPDDVLLLYFSGHGLKAETGELFLAANNTRPTRLSSSAVPATFVQHCMTMSRSRGVVLFLDCCYGGAFPQGVRVRAAGSVDVMSTFVDITGRTTGRGRAVITASNSMEYAFEGARLVDSQTQPSVFASALYEGLRTGDADRDEDGVVSIGELYEWLYDRVRKANPAQTPSRQFDLQGELFIARSGRRKIRPATLPPDLEAALADPSMFARIGALTELRHRLASEDLATAMAACQALRKVATQDIHQVAVVAQEILDGLILAVDPPSVTLRQTAAGGSEPQVLNLSGLPLARAVTSRTNSPALRIRTEGASVTVSLAAPGATDMSYVVTLDGPAGLVTVPIEIARDHAPEQTTELPPPIAPEFERPQTAMTAPSPAPPPAPIEPAAQAEQFDTWVDGAPRVSVHGAGTRVSRRRSRVAVLLAVALLLSAIGVGVWRAVSGNHVLPPKVAVLPLDRLVAPIQTAQGIKLWSINVDTGAHTALTNGSGDDFKPAISPNRRSILYVHAPSYTKGPYTLMVMAADGTGVRPLFSGQPAAALELGGPGGRPSWSPGGRAIAAVAAGSSARKAELYVISVADGVAKRLASDTSLGDPCWTRDGRDVTYWASARKGATSGTLMHVAVGGQGQATRVLVEVSEVDADPAWSPDGSTLAFRRSSRDGADIWVVDSHGVSAQPLTQHQLTNGDPSWSPDGRSIAFRSSRTGDIDEYVMNADGGQPRRLLRNPGVDYAPSWFGG